MSSLVLRHSSFKPACSRMYSNCRLMVSSGGSILILWKEHIIVCFTEATLFMTQEQALIHVDRKCTSSHCHDLTSSTSSLRATILRSGFLHHLNVTVLQRLQVRHSNKHVHMKDDEVPNFVRKRNITDLQVLLGQFRRCPPEFPIIGISVKYGRGLSFRLIVGTVVTL